MRQLLVQPGVSRALAAVVESNTVAMCSASHPINLVQGGGHVLEAVVEIPLRDCH
jgi:hypothetical protein